MLPTVEESRGYDFQDPENVVKWRGLFVTALRKVLEQVHPSLNCEQSALEFAEQLLLRLLSMLCAAPCPLTVQDVEDRVARTFPNPLDKWAMSVAREATVNRKTKPVVLPVDKIHNLLQKEVLLYKIDLSVTLYITAILEFVSSDIFKLAGNFVKKISQKSGYDTITFRDVKTAMCADKVLMDMFYQDSELALADPAASCNDRRRRGSLTYPELVNDLLIDVRGFLRELNLIIRVFKDKIETVVDNDTEPINLIFGNIMDIYELTVTLLGNLEDACEVAQDTPSAMPYIGSCFEELAEVEEFRAYVRYAHIITKKESRDALQNMVDDPLRCARLDTAGHGFRLAVKYFLPRLLLAPLAHVFLYHSYVLALLQIAPTSDDRESFKQVECNLHPIKKVLMKALGNGSKMDATLKMATRARRQQAVDKCNELVRILDNWDPKDMMQSTDEFIREDTLTKIGPGKRMAERRAFLFDGLLLLCKPVTSVVSVAVNSNHSSGAGGAQQLKLKEKLHIRKLDIADKQDTDEFRNLFELKPREGPGPVLLACATSADKRNWMCDLIMLNTKPMLDRVLDGILLDLESKHPLILPPTSMYRYAAPDSPQNIVLEERKENVVPIIKGATLLKLIERITYHRYADLNLVRTFLTTYRSFCSPNELLDLLIERFRMPEPSEFNPSPKQDETIEGVGCSDAEKLSKNTVKEDWKRYRKEYQQPVKFRVINVIRHWVDQHFYDFERDPEMLEKLRCFLETVEGKPMKKWVLSVLKTMQRKSAQPTELELEGVVTHVFNKSPPAVLRHVHDPERCGWHPLALHPLELARQLTLLEFQLYRQVKPSELVGAVWTKKDKEKSSPNLLRIIKHTTNFTRWMEKWIVESENLEERVGVVCRVLETGLALLKLNNFNGVLAVTAATNSASVHRLKLTFQMIPPRLTKALEEFRELNSGHFKKYRDRLRSINPPCVPFFGMYLTNILHIEEGNLDYLPNSELLNISKRRKVAEITGEIQQYQNQPYCLIMEPKTRAFLESLDPFPGMDDTEITNYLYAKSLEIEPRPPVKQMPKFPRKYPELSLKQVKVSRRNNQQVNDIAHNNNNANNDDNLSVSQLSPTSSTWDAYSVASLPIHYDEHRGSRSDEKSLISPRLERCASNTFSQFSLFDKGLALFDKSKSTASLASKSTKDEPASPRDRHSPRHDRQPQPAGLSPIGSGIQPAGSGERKALSPRGAIVDANTFYPGRAADLLPKRNEERVPPLLPRNSIISTNSTPAAPAVPVAGSTVPTIPPTLPVTPVISPVTSCSDVRPPVLPRRDTLHKLSDSSPVPPPPPERPPPSPKHHDLNRVPAMSPKRSPAPQPPPSPLITTESRTSAFNFPTLPSAAPPLTPHTLPPTSSTSACGTPPPLPPRRRKDSLPHTPAPPAPPAPSPNARPPPPLPPRPAPAPELLHTSHSTILQRRHHTNFGGGAPLLPPKGVAGAGAGGGGGAGGARP